MRPQLLYLLILAFLLIVSQGTCAVVDVGIESVTVGDLSPDYPTDRSPEPREDFEVNVTVKNYGNEPTDGYIEIYLDDEKKDSYGKFSIKPKEVTAHKFIISHNDCGRYNVVAKIVMEDNTHGHEWELMIPVKIGNKFNVTFPEKAIVNRPVQVMVRDDLGLEVENARIDVWIGSTYRTHYKGGTTQKNEIFSFTPDHPGEFLINIKKGGERYCEYKKIIWVKHDFTIHGPYSSRYPGNPVVGDEIVMRIDNENGEAVPGVLVNVLGPKEAYLNTDRSGGVLFVADEPGEYLIEIEKSIPPYWGVNKTLIVRAKPMLEMTISPETPLVGDDVTIKIINENASNVNITVTNPEGFGRTLTTDEDNEVNFDVSLLGDYIIRAEHVDYAAITKKIEIYNLLKILIEPETPAVGGDVTIIVLDQDGYSVPGVVVTIKGEEGEEESIETTDHNGEVKFKLKSSKYRILAEKRDYISASAVIDSLVKKLSLKLSSKKSGINKDDIYISVSDEDTQEPVVVQLVINGERSGVKYEEIASEFSFTPELADTYRVSATKENYGGAEDTFIIEPAPIGIDTVLENKELIIKITSDDMPVKDVDVSVITPKSKIITTTDEKGIASIDVEAEEEGSYLIQAHSAPNYESSEVGVDIIKDQEYWWLWIILIIILVVGVIVWKF